MKNTGEKHKRNIKILKIVLYAFLVLLAIASLIPFAVMIVNATRSNSEILRGFTLIPSDSLVENFEILTNYMDVGRGFLNSLFVAVTVTVFNSYFSALTAFSMAFHEFSGKKLIFGTFLIVMMVPGQLGLLGQYELNSALGILDTYWPLIIPAIAAPFVVFFFYQYLISSMQISILEAARIDGASELYMFHRIVLPILRPAIATQGIFTFIGTWNNYIGPLVMLRTPSKFTLPVMMASLQGSPVAQNMGAMYLGVAISVVPIMIAFSIFSKNIINSISAGAVK